MSDNKNKWAVYGPGYRPHIKQRSVPLQSGVYVPAFHEDQLVLQQKNPISDEIITITGGIVDKVLAEIDSFWSKRDLYKRYGFLHKRGVLMHGKPGIGKTMTVHQIMQGVVDRGGIVLLCEHPGVLGKMIEMVRLVEPERPIVTVFEDIDSIIENHGQSTMLQLLDGYEQTDNILQIATTNYLDRLPARIKDRPRRFDTVIEVLYPTEPERRQFFTKKLTHGEDIEEMVTASKGMSYAAMSEFIILRFILGVDVKVASNKLLGISDELAVESKKHPFHQALAAGLRSSLENEEEESF